jgi:hypothetical protein
MPHRTTRITHLFATILRSPGVARLARLALELHDFNLVRCAPSSTAMRDDNDGRFS